MEATLHIAIHMQLVEYKWRTIIESRTNKGPFRVCPERSTSSREVNCKHICVVRLVYVEGRTNRYKVNDIYCSYVRAIKRAYMSGQHGWFKMPSSRLLLGCHISSENQNWRSTQTISHPVYTTVQYATGAATGCLLLISEDFLTSSNLNSVNL